MAHLSLRGPSQSSSVLVRDACVVRFGAGCEPSCASQQPHGSLSFHFQGHRTCRSMPKLISGGHSGQSCFETRHLRLPLAIPSGWPQSQPEKRRSELRRPGPAHRTARKSHPKPQKPLKIKEKHPFPGRKPSSKHESPRHAFNSKHLAPISLAFHCRLRFAASALRA